MAATAHYYRLIHHGKPERVLVVDSWNWQVGRNIYFVPANFAGEVEGLTKRHNQAGVGARTEIFVLHWSEFERRYPRPSRAILELVP